MCSPKTMLKIGVIISVPLSIGFIVFPQFRVTILGLAPFALFALCPISMIFGMKGMMGDKKSESSKPEEHKKQEANEKAIDKSFRGLLQ